MINNNVTGEELIKGETKKREKDNNRLEKKKKP